MVESYVVGRVLAGVPLTEGTSGNIIGILNRLQRALAAGEPIKTAAYQWLAQTRNEAKRWPSDAEVVDKVSDKPHEMTPTWRDMVLHAIEDRLRIDQGLAPTDRKLRTVTLIPPGEAGTTNYPIQESRPTPSRQQRREDALKQLGNLTLINGPMRKREQEARLEKKRESLEEHRDILLTQVLIVPQKDDFTEQDISDRSKWMATLCTKIWPREEA